jgi:guanyl-specific ribonuclease Sa
MTRRKLALVALCALFVIAGGWALLRIQPSTPDTTKSSEPTTTTVGGPTCPLATLPPEVADTVRGIHAGGPFPFPRNDGVIFGNREGHLPQQTKGYYHEYTVISPGARNRSTRRIITGGAPVTNPGQYFYTADHYDSFCLVTDAGRQS